jgi:prepilin-type N-terminal cleavage/methylation domain
MKKNKKGFTLVEILGVIIVLSVISLIVIPLVGKQINDSRQKLYEKQIGNMNQATNNWAADNLDRLKPNEKTFVTLGELQDGGYIDKNIKNPRTREEYSRDMEFYVLYKDDGKIEIMVILECGAVTNASTTWTNQNRTITVACKNGMCEKGTYSKTFTETAKTGVITIKDGAGNEGYCKVDVYIDKEKPKCESSGGNKDWTNGNRNITGKCTDTGGSGCVGNITKSYASDINTTTAGPGTVKDKAGNETTCPANQTVRIDKTPPSCTNSGGNTSWTNGSRTIKGTCSDTGVGCEENVTKTYSVNTNTTTASPGIVRDKLGNETTCPANQTVRVDKTAPSCTSSGGSATWTNGNRTLTGTCTDSGGSGCDGNVTKAFSSNTNLTNQGPGTVKDKAGNETACPANQTVRIDKTAPSCTSSGGNAAWTNGNRTLTGTCADSGGSGCVGNVTKTYSTNTNSTTQGPGVVKDNAGNETTCSNNQTVRIDRTAPTCASSGGSATWTKGNRTLTGTCTDTGGSGCVGNITKTYSTNTNSTTQGPGLIKDKAGNETTCPTNQTVKIDKTAPTCTSSGGNATWTNGNRTLTGTCADTGGSGCDGNITKTYSTNTNSTTQGPGLIKDKAGNETTCPTNQTVRIDKTAPKAPTVTNPNGNSWTNQDFSLTLNSSDTGGSGIAYYQWGYASDPWYTYANSASNSFVTTPFSKERNEIVYIRAVDNAGNSSDASTSMIRIDKTPPASVSIINPNGNNWTNKNFSLTLNSSDARSGIAYYQWGYASDPWQTYANSASNSFVTPQFSAERNEIVYVRAVDNAGNVTAASTSMIRIDKTGPVITYSSVECNKVHPINNWLHARVTNFWIRDVLSGYARINLTGTTFEMGETRTPTTTLVGEGAWERTVKSGNVTIAAWDLAGNRSVTTVYTSCN